MATVAWAQFCLSGHTKMEQDCWPSPRDRFFSTTRLLAGKIQLDCGDGEKRRAQMLVVLGDRLYWILVPCGTLSLLNSWRQCKIKTVMIEWDVGPG